MKRDELVALLRKFKADRQERYGILDIGIFGSVARNEQTAGSDVDICIKTKTPNPFTLVHIKAEIEALVQTHVDIVRVRENMNPMLKARIAKDGLYV